MNLNLGKNNSNSKSHLLIKDSKNIINPLYEKTRISTSGVELSYINSYLTMFFGEKSRRRFMLPEA